MGFFDKIFRYKTSDILENKNIPWNNLTSLEQINEIIEESKEKPVAIFKNSTRCGISRMALRQFEKYYDMDTAQMKLYYLDLLAFRNISDEVGFKFQVMHQSPQLILIKNGMTIHHSSHYKIDASNLKAYV